MARVAEYLTIKEAAEYLGVCTNTLRNWGASGKIKDRRNPMNGYRLFSLDDLQELLHRIENSGESTSPHRPPRRKGNKPR